MKFFNFKQQFAGKAPLFSSLAMSSLFFGNAVLYGLSHKVTPEQIREEACRASFDSSAKDLQPSAQQLMKDQLSDLVENGFEQARPPNPCVGAGCTYLTHGTEQFCQKWNAHGSYECGTSWNWFDDDFMLARTRQYWQCPKPGGTQDMVYCGSWSVLSCCTGGANSPTPDCEGANGEPECGSGA